MGSRKVIDISVTTQEGVIRLASEELRFNIDRRDRRRQVVTSRNSQHKFQVQEKNLVPRELGINWILTDCADANSTPITIKQGVLAKNVSLASQAKGNLTTVRSKFLEVDKHMQWKGKSYRWAAGSCTFRGKRLQIWLDDEETGQDIACLEGSQSYLPTSELDTLIIRGNKQSLTDPEWIKIVVASGMAMARQCRKDLNPGIVHAAAC